MNAKRKSSCLIDLLHRSRPSSAKMKPAQTTQNVAPESDHISNKDFEEYERPKRRNRALDKLSLSGFVKSSGREKAKKTGINQVLSLLKSSAG